MSCKPILLAPNGTLWQLGVIDSGLLTTTQLSTSFKYLQAPILGVNGIAWQLAATNSGLITSSIVVSTRPPISYIPMVSSGNLHYNLTIDTFGLFHTAQTNTLFPESIPYPNDVSMSTFGVTGTSIICPVCNNASVTVSGDLSCWCCSCSSFVLPEDTTIIVVLDE